MNCNIYHYIVKLPDGVNEVVMPCSSGFTIYTADRLTYEKRKEVYKHALKHIERNDWELDDVQEIETESRK